MTLALLEKWRFYEVLFKSVIFQKKNFFLDFVVAYFANWSNSLYFVFVLLAFDLDWTAYFVLPDLSSSFSRAILAANMTAIDL